MSTIEEVKERFAAELAPPAFAREDLIGVASVAGDVAYNKCLRRREQMPERLFSDYELPPSASVIDSQALAIAINKSGPLGPEVLHTIARQAGWRGGDYTHAPPAVIWGLRAFCATYSSLLPAMRYDESRRAEAQAALQHAEQNTLTPQQRRRAGIAAGLRDPNLRGAILAAGKAKLQQLTEKPKRGAGGKFLPRK